MNDSIKDLASRARGVFQGPDRLPATLRASRMCVACAVVGMLAAGGASVAAAEELRIAIGSGRVTLIADDAALGDVLAAWARAGGTRFTGAGPIEAARVSLHLVDVDESQALGWLLQPAAGYVAVGRARSDPDASRYERVEIHAAPVPPRPLAARDQPAGSETVRPESEPEAPPALSEAQQRERLRQLLRPNHAGEAEAVPAPPPASGAGHRPPTTPRPGMVVASIPPERPSP